MCNEDKYRTKNTDEKPSLYSCPCAIVPANIRSSPRGDSADHPGTQLW